MRIGIMGAMDEEVALILSDMENIRSEKIGIRTYHSGSLYDKDVVLAVSGWGKVASASTATAMLIGYSVETIIFSGVAGAACDELNIGDIVIASQLVQHDLDASPIFPKYQVPLLGISHFKTDAKLKKAAISAAENFASNEISSHIDSNTLSEFAITKPKVYEGLIASGDKFISSCEALAEIKKDFPDLKCVEMEGAAVAQVCYEHNVPLTVVRVISDKADSDAEINFPLFISKVASQYSRGIICNLLDRI